MKIQEKYYLKKWRRLSGWILLLFALICIALGAFGIYIGITRHQNYFEPTGVWFLIGGLVTSGLIFPLALKTTLFIGLGPDGFVLNSFWFKKSYRWIDCSDFSPGLYHNFTQYIIFDTGEKGRLHQLNRWWHRGGNRSFGNLYDISTSDLLKFMNAYRQAAMNSGKKDKYG